MPRLGFVREVRFRTDFSNSDSTFLTDCLAGQARFYRGNGGGLGDHPVGYSYD